MKEAHDLKPFATLLAVALATSPAVLVTTDASAADAAIALGELSVTSPTPGVDTVTLKDAAELELKNLTTLRTKKTYVVSFSVIRTTDSPVACQVNAMLRERRTGSMFAIIQGNARAEGNVSAALRTAVLRAAVRTAVSQIPEAVGVK